jgi:outer membrane protein OmpA-like peptidoglycan-associated protein
MFCTNLQNTRIFETKVNKYMIRHIFFTSAFILLIRVAAFAQMGSWEPRTDVAYWVDYWSRHPVIVQGPEGEAFYQNMQVILFPNDGDNDPSNPDALDSDVRWLKDHPNVRFYVDGYASSRGDWLYNLGLAQRRADWVKQILVGQGIAEDRIRVSAGFGELYPVCPETDDECWSKNRLVRFLYSPN